MAVVSNTCNGSLGNYCKVYLEYIINNTEEDRIERNKSNITLNLYAQATSTSVGAYNLNGNASANIKTKIGSTTTTRASSSKLNMDFRNKKKVSMLSWTGDIAHNDDGTLTITISGSFDTNGPSSVTTGSVSYEWKLPTIPRASSVTCSDGNIGSATTININRASSSFTHTITYDFQGLTGTIATKTSSTSLGWTIPTSFYTKIPNAKSGQGTITCQTYSGDTLVGTSTCTFNAMVLESSNKPIVTATIKDVNASTVALTGDADKLIKYFSNAQVDIVATAKNSATIKSQKVVCGAKIGTSITNVLNNIESGTFNLSCIDSRGFTDNDVIEKEMINYVKLVFIDLLLTRPTTTSNTINLALRGQYYKGSFGSVNNDLELKVRYRQVNGEWSEYISLTPVISDNNEFAYSASLGDIFNYKNDYEFEFIATDKLMSEPQKVIVPAGEPIVDIGKEDVIINGSLTVNKLASVDELQIKNLETISDCNDTNLDTGFYYCIGDTLNTPFVSAWFLNVIKRKFDDGDIVITQIIYRYQKNEIYTRNYNAIEPAGWKDWKPLHEEDSGWIKATLTNNFTCYGNNTENNPQYRKVGRMVEIKGIVAPKTDLTANTRYVICNLPEEYRPNLAVNILCQGTTSRIWLLTIETNGEVALSRYREGSNWIPPYSSNWFPFNATFFVD